MPHEDTPEVGGKNEEPDTGADNQREQMEQSGEEEKLRSYARGWINYYRYAEHEKPDGNRRMSGCATESEGVLETMEKSANEV